MFAEVLPGVLAEGEIADALTEGDAGNLFTVHRRSLPAPKRSRAPRFPLLLGRPRTPGKQERGGQVEQSRHRKGGTRAGGGGEQPAERGAHGDGRLLADRPGRQGTGDEMPGRTFEPVGGEHRGEPHGGPAGSR